MKSAVRLTRTMLSAISFGVSWRRAPSIIAIIRSRNELPSSAVTRMTIRSLVTRVPPVTALRSPPLSRTTGADSPVIADSSTVAMPATTSPSAAIRSPAVQTMRSPILSSLLGTTTSRSSDQLAGGRLGPHPAQLVGVRLSPALGHRLGEVREEAGEPQPEADLQVEAREVDEQPDRRQDRAEPHDEHDEVLDLVARVQLREGADHGLADQAMSSRS